MIQLAKSKIIASACSALLLAACGGAESAPAVEPTGTPLTLPAE